MTQDIDERLEKRLGRLHARFASGSKLTMKLRFLARHKLFSY